MIENDILHDITSAYESIQLKCESYISDSYFYSFLFPYE